MQPLHWVGVLLMLLGLVTIFVRVYTNRCGTKPEWSGFIAMITIAACLASWLLAEGPLYNQVKVRSLLVGSASTGVRGFSCLDSRVD